MGSYCLVGTVSLWEDEKVTEMDEGNKVNVLNTT